MPYVVLIIAKAIDLCCNILAVALLIRMLFPMIDPKGEGLISGFAAFITEPLIILSEKILVLLKIDNSGPLDISVTVAYVLIILLNLLLIPILG